MRKLINIMSTAACLSLLIGTAAQASDSPTLKIENFIGSVDIVTGDYDGITVTNADGAPVDKSGKDVTINADQTIKDVHCKTNNMTVKIGIGSWKYLKHKGGYEDIDTYPKIKIKAPKNTHLIIDNSVIFGDIEAIGSGDIHMRSCGDLSLGDVAGVLDLVVSGSADMQIGDAGKSDISISGSGDLKTGDLASARIHVSGSGDLEVGDILGHADISTSGASDVDVGRIKGGLEYEGSGASDFEVDYVGGGDLSIRASGSGDVDINKGSVQKLYIRASGASDVHYGGHSVDGEAHASGASDISIRRPSGNLQSSDSGAGDVRIRH